MLTYSSFPANVSDQEIKSMPLCDACQRSKFTSRRMQGRGERTAEFVGQKVITDMKGPIQINGLDGERYYQGFMDVQSRYIIHYNFRKKSSALINLRSTLALPLFSGKLQYYHSDSAPELLSKDIVALLRERGIKNTFSSPYKHTDNAQIERSHRVIFEMAHAMLLHAQLSMSFWCYAVDHSVCL